MTSPGKNPIPAASSVSKFNKFAPITVVGGTGNKGKAGQQPQPKGSKIQPQEQLQPTQPLPESRVVKSLHAIRSRIKSLHPVQSLQRVTKSLKSIVDNIKAHIKDHINKKPPTEEPQNNTSDDDQPDPEDLKDPEFPIRGYIVLNCLLVLWGLIGLVATVAFHGSDPTAEDFVHLNRQQVDTPPRILYVCCCLTCLSSLLAIGLVLLESSVFFPFHPYVNGVVIGMDLMACLSAILGTTPPRLYPYQRILEADILATYANDSTYVDILGTQYKGYWDKFQRKHGCCGVDGIGNWVQSICKCLPLSCCVRSKYDKCVSAIQGWTPPSTPSGPTDLTKVKEFLWPKTCIEVISQEMFRLKLNWIFFPLVLLFFQLLLMTNINYLVVSARNRYNVPGGFSHIREFKYRVKERITSVVKRICGSVTRFCSHSKRRCCGRGRNAVASVETNPTGGDEDELQDKNRNNLKPPVPPPPPPSTITIKSPEAEVANPNHQEIQPVHTEMSVQQTK